MTWKIPKRKKKRYNYKLKHKTLKEHVHYDPLTGLFTRLITTSAKAIAGTIAGSAKKDNNYCYVMIDKERILEHVLAWFYMTGEWPEQEIDHRDLNKSNNVWTNLRLSTRSGNCSNKSKSSTNTSGFKGVTLRKNKRWLASIKHNGKYRHLGVFDTAEEAHKVYIQAAKECFGEFSRVA